MSPLLDVRNLTINFAAETGTVEAVKGISFSLGEGETLAVVGESGSGKSVTALALTRLLPEPPAVYKSGEILFKGRDVLKSSPRELRPPPPRAPPGPGAAPPPPPPGRPAAPRPPPPPLRGASIAYIFQEPSTSLNPVFTIRNQIAEAIRLHRPEVKNVNDEVVKYLDMVGIVNPRQRMHDYPHQLSGGMQQRAMHRDGAELANPRYSRRGRADDGARCDNPGADH